MPASGYRTVCVRYQPALSIPAVMPSAYPLFPARLRLAVAPLLQPETPVRS